VLLRRLPGAETRYLAALLRQETVGGALLLAAAAVAVVWASSPWADGYERLRHTVVGPALLHLDLTLEQWTSDGLLAVFFFVAGLELKRELVLGSLRDRAAAALPVVAAFTGMVVPALVYLAVSQGDPSARMGWAIPMATDIAFALAVLAVLGSALPTPLRAFLLTLAVVDDLGAILVIAVAFTSQLRLLPLVLAGLGVALWAFLQHRRLTPGWLLVPLAVVVWALVHDSGVHATVAGVALGLLTRVRRDDGEDEAPAERLEHLVGPVSAGIAVPLFALFAAGVSARPADLRSAVADTAAVAVVAGLVVGKFVGVLGGAYLTARFTRARLDPSLSWSDLAGVSLLAGMGFTVSLLIADLSFDEPSRGAHVTTGVLVGSLLAATLAAVVLRARQRHYRRVGSG
jgi:NhaA family Na+:H+ antiporter